MSPKISLVAERLTVVYGERVVVDALSMVVPPGRLTAVVGPNGCGKSTLLRALARLVPHRSGAVLLDGRSIHRWPTREVATRLGILPQAPVAPDGITVAELVARGRTPHLRWSRPWREEDSDAVTRAMAATRVDALAARPVDELSGGQRQRAWLAMALAQETELLLLDEPTTYLDLAHQLELLELLEDLVSGAGGDAGGTTDAAAVTGPAGRTVVLVLHDLNLAARHCRHLIAVREGRIVAAGPPEEIVSPALVEEVFGLRCEVVADPCTGTPLVVPHGRATRYREGGLVRHT